MTYSYDPTKISDGGLNEVRFALGDVFVETPERDAYLSDEEILEAIASSKSLKRAELKLVESLLARFSYEVDEKIREAEWKLSDRIKNWEALRKRLKGETDSEEILSGGAFGLKNSKARPPIFRIGMNDVFKSANFI